MGCDTIKQCIQAGNAVLGIEFGSTRIKAVLIDESHGVIAVSYTHLFSRHRLWRSHNIWGIWKWCMFL